MENKSLPKGVPTLTPLQSYPGNKSKLSFISLVLSTHQLQQQLYTRVRTVRKTSGLGASGKQWNESSQHVSQGPSMAWSRHQYPGRGAVKKDTALRDEYDCCL